MGGTYNPGLQAAMWWKEDYADLRLSYERGSLDAALLSFLRLEMADDCAGADSETIYMFLCIAFCKLSQRGAIAPVRPLSSEGERQLDELLRNFNVVTGPAEEPDAELTLIEQVVQDWNMIGMDAFGKKRRADVKYEAAYVKAIEQGKIA